MTVPKVGFIGLGRMGTAMATNLARAGVDLTVWNRTKSKADAFAEENGARVAETLSLLTANADVVVTMVTDGQALNQIYRAADGVLAGLQAGKVVVDMGTVGPSIVGEIVPSVESTGARFLDAPVSGSVASAQAATLMIMVGGDGETVEATRPVLELMGNPVLHVGEVGSGASLKLAINNVIYAINQAVSEALVLAERAGMDRSIAYEAFTRSAIAAPVVNYRRNQFVEPYVHPVTMSVDLAIKDLELIVGLAEAVGLRLPQAIENLAFLKETSAAGLGDADMASTADHLRAT